MIRNTKLEFTITFLRIPDHIRAKTFGLELPLSDLVRADELIAYLCDALHLRRRKALPMRTGVEARRTD